MIGGSACPTRRPGTRGPLFDEPAVQSNPTNPAVTAAIGATATPATTAATAVLGATATRTRIKICGIRDPADALFAADAGADAIGLVFHRPSPRDVDLERAHSIARAVPPFVATVGLFVNPARDDVRRALDMLPLSLLQFHGDETDDFCAQFGRPYLKALRVKPGVSRVDLLQSFAGFRGASAILADAYRAGVVGGTGETFDWDLLPSQRDVRIVLSGGLTPDNVGDGIARVRPWAVDVSSGVESSPGVKDCAKIARFIDAVHRADLADRGTEQRQVGVADATGSAT